MGRCLGSYLLENGADPALLTEEGQRPLDLVDPSDLATVAVMLRPAADRQVADSEDDDPEEEEEEEEERRAARRGHHDDNG